MYFKYIPHLRAFSSCLWTKISSVQTAQHLDNKGYSMKIVYQAANIIEAHLVTGLLQAHEIQAFVSGHYLQGGVGEIAPTGFANVSVADDDVQRAINVVTEYEQNARSTQFETAEFSDYQAA